MFKDEHRLPPYVLPYTAELNPGLEGEREERRRAETARRFAWGTGD
jgi:hypothetical protein